MKSLFRQEVRNELDKYANRGHAIITEADIAPLPEPVQRYFRICGYLGKEMMNNVLIEWQSAWIKLSPSQDWLRLQCRQFHSVPEPTRIAYMKSRMMGVIPFEGKDKYQDGHANMLIKLCKVLKVADAKGKEMDESELVTILAESLLIPSYALQPYMTWTAIDQNTAKAVLRWNGCEVSGIFHFQENGELIRIDTDDRYYSEKGTEYKKLKWSGVVSSYIEQNGIRFPSCFCGIWHTDTGEYEYFKGTIGSITYNISQLAW